MIDKLFFVIFEFIGDFFEVGFFHFENGLPLGRELAAVNLIEVIGELSLLALSKFVAQSGLGCLAARKQKHLLCRIQTAWTMTF